MMSPDMEYAVPTSEPLLGGRLEKSGRLDKRSYTKPATVLIVDDDINARTGVRRLLQQYGYTTLEAEHGAAALQLLRNSLLSVDVVLTDVIMPEMTGIELVRQLGVEFPTLPVIYLSAYVSHPAVQKQIDRADQWALTKPVSAPVLMAAIQSALTYRVPDDQLRVP